MAARTTLRDATVSNNAETGIWTFLTRLDNTDVTGNGLASGNFPVRIGVFDQIRSKIFNSTITGNGSAGIAGRRIDIQNSTVTGNDAYADCATTICADLQAELAIRAISTQCDTSSRRTDDSWIGAPIPPGGAPNWGICSLD